MNNENFKVDEKCMFSNNGYIWHLGKFVSCRGEGQKYGATMHHDGKRAYFSQCFRVSDIRSND